MTSPDAPAFTFAFQPVVDVTAQTVVGHEALVRGTPGQGARHVFAQIPPAELYDYDLLFRQQAIALAARLGISGTLYLNLLPASLDQSAEPVEATLAAAARHGLRPDQVTLELSEAEVIHDVARFVGLINRFRGQGMGVVLDDFGAGYSGLNLLAQFQPDAIKLDMALVRGIERDGPRQAIVRGIVRTCSDLGVSIVAEGVETVAEFAWCHGAGIELFQGYLFARPAVAAWPAVTYPPVAG
ncbi:MAG: EAL domain-containing protein [Kofleriaceae bacterium]